METGSKNYEDLTWLKEMAFGNATKGFISTENLGKSKPLIVLPGFPGGFVDGSIKGKMIAEKIPGVVIPWGSFTGLESLGFIQKIDRTVNRFPGADIWAHSSSGLSVILWAEKFNMWNKFSRIFTIGTPFAGITIPSFVKPFNKTLRELSYGSPMIERVLKVKPPLGEDGFPQIISISGKDEHSTVPVKLNWPTIVLGTNSHGDIQNHSEWFYPFLDLERIIT